MTPDEKRERKRSLRQLVENFRARGATAHPKYLDALRELDGLESRGLDVERSKAAVLDAARRGAFTGMKTLAAASGVDFLEARYALGGHLHALNCWAVGHGFPMIGAVVVNEDGLESGTMAPKTLKGFLTAAEDLGRFPPKDAPDADEEAFLRAEQRRVFEWAKEGRA